MLKTLSLALALGFSGAAIAQQAQPGPARPDAKGEGSPAVEQSAAGGASRPRCDFMSREEMQMCQRTKPGDASGVRSSQCDVVGADIIESCLKQQEPVSSHAANELKDPKQQPR
jgi:hypothetical protein